MVNVKQKTCEYEGCEIHWDARGDRGCGGRRYCKPHKILVVKKRCAEYYQRTKVQFKERQDKWIKENPEKFRCIQLNYRERNREKLRAKARADYQKNKSARKNKYSMTKEYIAAKSLRHYRENREQIKARRRARYAEKKRLLRGDSKGIQ